MVVLMDYACPTCKDVGDVAFCPTCKNKGSVRMSTGTIPYSDPHKELVINRGDVFAKVDIIEGRVKVNGVDVPVNSDDIIAVIEAIGCEYEIEEYDEYEAVDCVDYIEENNDPETCV